MEMVSQKPGCPEMPALQILLLGSGEKAEERRKSEMKIGLALKVDVTKIDKTRLYKGQKGTYLDLTAFIDSEEVSKYGDHGTIAQSKKKGEDIKLPILGNARIFWRDDEPIKKELEALGPVDPTDDSSIPF
ncbi:MAG: hypothetical protein U9Q84_01470 [Thermodesulfobacteriota bacterium]|nr:hypothetical protein [Thermodesulfobacteriota bacterium]